MKTIPVIVSCFAVGALFAAEPLSLVSPDGNVVVNVEAGASPTWSLARKGKTLLLPSRLGLDFIGSPWKDFRLVGTSRRTLDSTWKTPLYRKAEVRDHANELVVSLADAANRRLDLVFRAYDGGAAYRYVVPAQEGFDGFQLRNELGQWRFPEGSAGWFTLYDDHYTSQEQSFDRMALASIPARKLVGMPAVVEAGGQVVALCEANLSNWAGLFYRTPAKGQSPGAATLESALSPLPRSSASAAGLAVIRMTPAASPWRVALCADSALGLVDASDVIMNLNPPPEPGIDFSWVKPGASSWDWWFESNNSLSTEVTLKLVDFAAEMGWPYHTIDGGWYGWARRPNHGPNVPVEIRKGFDLKRIVAHAAARNVGIWVWLHWEAIEDNGIEETFAKLESWGVKGAKIDFMDRQDQWMVCWYEKVARAAARHHVMVNYHGAFKPTGTNRTWPNNLTREGIRGNEMTKFTAKITPVHCATLPFTRFLLGGGDFTPGSFGNVHLKDFVPQSKKGHRYGDENDRRMIGAEEIGTRAHALALCVAYDSPLTTLCDWPERYRGATGIEALRELPTVWKNTRALAGEVGRYYAVARETFDARHYLAAFTVEARTLKVPLDFLGAGEWEATLYTDDPSRTPADAKALAVVHRRVTCKDVLDLALAAEGGAVVVLKRK